MPESVNSRSGRFGDVGMHSKKIKALFDYTFLAISDEVKLHRLKRREENENKINVMVRGTEECDTDEVDRADSANDGAAKESKEEE